MYLAHTGAPLLTRVFAPCPIQGLGWVLAKDFHVVPHAKTCHYNTATQRLQQTPQAFPETEEPSPKAASYAIATTPVREKFQSWLRSFPNPVCLVRHCLKEMLACEHGDPNCAEGLACTQSCGKHNNTMGCLYSCLNSYEAQLLPGHVAGGRCVMTTMLLWQDQNYAAFVRCSVTDHACVTPVAPKDQACPA